MVAFRISLARRALLTFAMASAACAASVASVASVAFAATPNVALPHYDGLWSVSIITEKGDCDRGYRYPIRISHGFLGNAGDTAFTITGKVEPTGFIRVTVSYGSSSASGSGRLAGDTGDGLWAGGSCSGTWTAERRGS